MTEDEIANSLDALGDCRTVVISGGEPTIQLNDFLLVTLLNRGYRLHLETNGSRPLGTMARYFSHITCSPKQPLNETKIEYVHDLKLLYPPIHPEITVEKFDTFPTANKFLQPIEEGGDAIINAEKTIKKLFDFPQWRLSLQTHKLLGVE